MNCSTTRMWPYAVILYAGLAAALMAWGHPVSVWSGALLTVPLVVLSLRNAWVGWLAIFPLVFGIRPAPPVIGIQEIMFALLIAATMIRSLTIQWQQGGRQAFLHDYFLPVLVCTGLIGVNLAVALTNGVPFVDWARGLIPFAFICIALPLAYELKQMPERMYELIGALAALYILFTGHVVLVFLAKTLYQPYWLIGTGESAVRIGATQLAAYPDAIGPMQDRVTMLLPRSTDALLPTGMVIAAIAAIRLPTHRSAFIAWSIAMLGLTAILVTYTRSMLLSALLVLFIYVVVSIVLWRTHLLRTAVVLSGLALGGMAVIYSTGIDNIWMNRMGALTASSSSSTGTAKIAGVNQTSDVAEATSAADINVTTRLEEIRIAWQSFLDHPVAGTGLGAKHPMQFYGEQGVIKQQVAYIHNWLFYFLMATGVIGAIAYASLLLTPVLRGWLGLRNEPAILTILRAGILTLTVYALFFAVFRLISFNILLAAIWAVLLALQAHQQNKETA